MNHIKRKICFVVSSEMTIKAFLLNHIRTLSDSYDISIVVNTHNTEFAKETGLAGINIIPLSIARNISLLNDVVALVKLTRIFRENAYDVVHSVTPKAGLLAMLSASLAGIKIRIHIFTGQIWCTRRGISRFLFKNIDRIISFMATNILVDSQTQRQFLISESIISSPKSSVLANGSISGVDVERFKPSEEEKYRQRDILSIPGDAFVFIFIGRMKKDKGVAELLSAFKKIYDQHQSAHLVLVGPDEDGILTDIPRRIGESNTNYHYVDYSDTPEKLFAMADVFCIPSYREGFGTVIIEAAATGVPSIGSDIYGIQDAILADETGFLIEAGNIEALSNKMEFFMNHSSVLNKFGAAARKRAIKVFSQDCVSSAWLEYYDKLFK